MDDYDYDYSTHEYDGDSDEDTEDASETESMKYQQNDGEMMIGGNRYYGMDCDNYIGSHVSHPPPPIGPGVPGMNDSNYEIKEQIYQDKLSQLKEQLAHLEKGTHPEFINGMKSINKDYEERLFFANCIYQLEQNLIETEFKIEKSAAQKEFDERNSELIDSLLADLEDKKKMLETDSNIELINDTSEPKTLTTRKLRRRPNDPIPLPDRRRRTSPAQINYLLEESELNDDLKAITKLLSSKSTGNRTGSNKNLDTENSKNDEPRIENGKLFYDKKWFHRGQNIYLVSSNVSHPANIIQLGTNEVYVKKTTDEGKMKIRLHDLITKKWIITRR